MEAVVVVKLRASPCKTYVPHATRGSRNKSNCNVSSVSKVSGCLKFFKYRLAGWLSIALQGRFARFFAALDLVQSFQSSVGPKGTSLALRVFPHLCRAFVRQGVCVLLLRHPLTVPLRRCKTIDMETNLPTILQCAPLPTLQCDSRNYYSKLLAQGPEHNN